MDRLKSKVAVITGGNSGIGFGIAEALRNEGAAGTIIGRNQTSVAHRAAPGMAIYSAAKAAVLSLAKGLSLDLLPRKIRVNALSPGSIDTPVFEKMVPPEHLEQVKQLWVNSIPVGKQGLPSDIGKAAVFLASDDSAYIVATEILSDGRMTNISLMK